ncbi:Uncharacterized protein Fot_14624 [Forsythia ovata]|uniref:Uncharacterized protein n=1 Tax=Forsythia ovata TaxID=205694 RepID=A0ABD1W793_9LAMI
MDPTKRRKLSNIDVYDPYREVDPAKVDDFNKWMDGYKKNQSTSGFTKRVNAHFIGLVHMRCPRVGIGVGMALRHCAGNFLSPCRSAYMTPHSSMSIFPRQL